MPGNNAICLNIGFQQKPHLIAYNYSILFAAACGNELFAKKLSGSESVK